MTIIQSKKQDFNQTKFFILVTLTSGLLSSLVNIAVSQTTSIERKPNDSSISYKQLYSLYAKGNSYFEQKNYTEAWLPDTSA